MPSTTSRLGLTYELSSDAPDGASLGQTLATELDSITMVFVQGDAVDRPAYGTEGRVYMATDTLEAWYDTGAAWIPIPTLNSASGNISTSGPGDAASAGSTNLAADAGHKHARESWGNSTDPQVLGTQAAGSSGRASDAQHVHPLLEPVNALGSLGAGSHNLSYGVNTLTLAGNVTLVPPTAEAGAWFSVQIAQAASGGPYTVTFSGTKWPNATPPVMTTTASAVDRYAGECSDGSTWECCIVGQAFG